MFLLMSTQFSRAYTCASAYVNGVENNSVAISLMLSLKNAYIDWTNVLGNEDNYLNVNYLIEYFMKLT